MLMHEQRHQSQGEQKGQCADRGGAGDSALSVASARPARVLNLFVRDGQVVWLVVDHLVAGLKQTHSRRVNLTVCVWCFSFVKDQ